VLAKSVVNRPHWARAEWNLRQYAGRKLYVFFGVVGRGQKQYHDTMFVDDVRLTGFLTPSPSPTPSGPPTPVPPGPGKPLAGPTYGPAKGWAPRAVAEGFDLPVQHGYDGRHTTVGFIAAADVNAQDLSQFLAANRVARTGTFRITPIDGGSKNGDPTVPTLDAETIAALAPGADVIEYTVPEPNELNLIDAYDAAIADAKKLSVLQTPFVQCASSDGAFDSQTNALALHASAVGVTFVVPSGNTGSACYDVAEQRNIFGVTTPGSDPYFVTVGGTESMSGAATATPCPCPISTPVAWDDRNVNFGGLTGGGISPFPIPSYQKGVRGSPASATKRNVPDLAFPAVDDDVYVTGLNELIDGASWSSSIATALFAETVEICGRIGFANPAIYAAYAKAPSKDFFDVTHGFNGGYVRDVPKGYTAARGYDNVSGLGMPRGFDFALSVCGRSYRP
ncbi:MAG: hypothetical protein JO199_06400, partial [Candidatus Eremiobacteraeota bacterium]|nr:hypothetical protein [Candidatus Eremiobacteraeota bacterium]